MDALLAPPAPEGGGSEGCGHPFPGPIMAELCSAPGVLAMGSALMDAPVEEMRLLEQVLIRTDPQSAQSVLDTPDTPMEERGWHCGQIFTPTAFHGRPRQNYFQNVCCLQRCPARCRLHMRGALQPGVYTVHSRLHKCSRILYLGYLCCILISVAKQGLFFGPPASVPRYL